MDRPERDGKAIGGDLGNAARGSDVLSTAGNTPATTLPCLDPTCGCQAWYTE